MLSCSEFVGQEDPLEKGTTTYSDILAWRIPMDGGVWQAVVHVTPWTVAWQARLSTGPAVSPGSLLEMQIIRAHLTLP